MLDYLMHGFLIAMVLWLIGRRQSEQMLFYLAGVTKICAGICLGLIFTYYYEAGDTLRYYLEARKFIESPEFYPFAIFGSSPIDGFKGQPRAVLFTKITTLIVYLTDGDYWVVTSYFSLISFFGYWFLYRQLSSVLPNLRTPAAVAILFFPSTVFWSAGILKGSLTNTAIMCLAALMIRRFYRKKWAYWELPLIAISISTVLFLKYYLLVLVVPVLCYALFDKWAHRQSIPPSYRAIAYVGIAVASMWVGSKINPNLRIMHLPEAIHRNQTDVYYMTESKSSIDLRIEPTWTSLIQQIPRSLFAGLFGPTLLDGGSPWSWIPKIENLFLLFASIWSLLLLVRQKKYSPDILVFAALTFVLILCTILPLAAPNYGALSRYKASMTPFLVLTVSILPYWWLRGKSS